MLRDVRFGLRILLKQPSFSLIAMLTLALGIGATSAVLSLIQGVLLTPPPYRRPQQLVLVTTARTDGQKMDSPRGWPAEQWMEWQKEAKSFQGIAAYDWTFNFLIRSDGSQSMQGMWVTNDYLPLMGLKAVAGRGFDQSDFGPGPVKVILLGYEFWQRVFNGDPQIIGKPVGISRWDVPLLLIGCGNAAALLLVRGLQRQQEYAVRSAIGMGRIALLRQVSTESLLLALMGGAFGVGLAFAVVQLFKLIAGHAVPRLDGVRAGWAVLARGLGA